MTKPAKLFLSTTILLSLIGLFFVFEASTVESFRLFSHQYYFVKQQAMWLLISMIAMASVYFVKPIWLQRFAWPIYIFGLLLVFLTLIPPFGIKLNGASRWLLMPWGGTLQPVEFFKLAIINFYAYLLSRKTSLRSFLFFLAWPVLLLLLQPDFGSLMVFVAGCFTMYFLSGVDLRKIGTLFLGGFILATLVVVFSPYRRDRLMTFLQPEAKVQDESYHVKQITLALGAGSLWGRGIGNSLQKHAYVPEASSDSIFAIVAEEIGFIGSSILLVLFAVYFISAGQMLKQAQLSQYENLLSHGLLFAIAIQLVFNLSAVVVILPLSGMPLPFFSQGGSSLLSVFLSSGILLRLSNKNVTIENRANREKSIARSRR